MIKSNFLSFETGLNNMMSISNYYDCVLITIQVEIQQSPDKLTKNVFLNITYYISINHFSHFCQTKISNTLRFQLLIWYFSFEACDNKLIIFGVLTIVQAQQGIWICLTGLWERQIYKHCGWLGSVLCLVSNCNDQHYWLLQTSNELEGSKQILQLSCEYDSRLL